MEANWRDLHGKVIKEFLSYINEQTESFILKGGTALAQCYNLNRFSEDIDLDSQKENIIHHIQAFCKLNHYDYRIAKDTVTVKRAFINYGNTEKPLKVEVSYRNKQLPQEEIKKINGIMVYSINKLAQMKSNAYNARDKIRDLFDLAFIINNYHSELSPATLSFVADALQYKGLEQVDYVLATQHDELIDNDLLIENFLEMHDKLGLLYDEDEWELSKEYYTKPISPSEIARAIHEECRDMKRLPTVNKIKEDSKSKIR